MIERGIQVLASSLALMAGMLIVRERLSGTEYGVTRLVEGWAFLAIGIMLLLTLGRRK